jgi:hypothetical protein
MPADSISPSVPDLQRRVDELREPLRREAAVAEILQVTNASGGDLALVLNAIIEAVGARLAKSTLAPARAINCTGRRIWHVAPAVRRF